MQRRQVRFIGRVQGVGFRATTRSIAKQFPVTGWVRNEPDGSVLMIAEGRPEDLDAFQETIRRRMGGFIHSEDAQTGSASGEFEGFHVAR